MSEPDALERVRWARLGTDPSAKRTEWILILVFIVLAVGIVTASYLAYQSYERSFRTEVEDRLSAIAELKVGELRQWRKDRLSDASIFHENPSFTALVRRFLERPEDPEAQRQLTDWLGKYPQIEDYTQVRLLDTQGVCRLAVPATSAPVGADTVQRLSQVLQSGLPAFQDFYRSEQDQRVYLAVMVPVVDASDAGRRLGVLMLRIDPSVYLYPFLRTWPTPSRTAETLLVRREGSEVVFLNELRFQPQPPLTLRAPLDQKALPAAQAALGREGIMTGTDYRGRPALAALRAVPDSPWSLVARMDTSELYAPIRQRLWQTLILVGTLLFGAGAGVGLIWRQQRLCFYRGQIEAAEALSASEMRYRRLFEAAKDGILVLDSETGVVVDVNPFLVELLSYSREQFLGKRIWELGFFRDIIANQAKLEELKAKDYVRYDDLALETADGRRVEVEFISAVYLVDHHRVIQCNIRDITERKRAESERQTAHRGLAEKTEEMESLLYASSHDLRTPLVNIQGFGQRLQQAVADLARLLDSPLDAGALRAAIRPIVSDRMPAALHHVVASTSAMDGLISGLLRLSRLTRMELKPERLDMDRLVQTTVATMEHQVREAEAELLVAPLPSCIGEAGQIGQVVSNLLDNALKYRSPQRPLRIRISGATRDSESVYCVQDNGTGIKPESHSKIWGVFVRLDPRGSVPGEGLGLTVVRRIVQRHGGRVWVDSAPDHGSRFFFALPSDIPIGAPVIEAKLNAGSPKGHST